MANINKNNVAYGLSQPTVNVQPEPIIALRAPTAADKAPLGTMWIDKPNSTPYIISSVVNNSAVWVNTSNSGGSGTFTDLTVNPGDVAVTAGNINLPIGDVNVTAGDITVTAGDINLPAGNVNLTAGILDSAGVSFDGGTNTLSEFVQSTLFTPSLEFGGASVGLTYDVQFGQYIKIGKLVIFTINIDLSAKGTSTGNARIVGLPYSPSTVDNDVPVSIWYGLITFSGNPTAVLDGTTTSIALLDAAGTGTNTTLTDANFSNGSNIALSGAFFTA